jgi:thiol-disulfide isomerase/thioredoxin
MKPIVRNVTIAALALAAAGAGLAVNQMGAQAAASPTLSADNLYTKSFPDAGGKAYPLSALKGHVVVINFWATWCVPCVKEIPELSKISASYGKKVQFIGIGIDHADKIAEFEKTTPASYPLLVADTGGTDLVREFGDNAGGLPFTIVIDAKGVVRETKMGPVDEEELRGWLKTIGAAA